MSRGYPDTAISDERFSPRNPPPDKESAATRIEDLNNRAVSIETQLENKDFKDFPDDDMFFRWRSRATSALSHIRAEIQFLERWSAGEVGTNGGRIAKQDDLLSSLANKIRQKAATTALEIRRDCPVVYTETNLPTSVEEAKERKHKLGAARIRVQEAFVSIVAEWQSNGLSMKRVQSVKAPLQAVLMDLELEGGIIKKYLQEVGTRSDKRGVDQRRVLCGALKRAAEQGFQLTEEEALTLNRLLTFLS